MPRARQLSVSNSNLAWFAVVLAALAIGWFIGGWKVALVAAVVTLIASEVAERSARAKRLRA